MKLVVNVIAALSAFIGTALYSPMASAWEPFDKTVAGSSCGNGPKLLSTRCTFYTGSAVVYSASIMGASVMAKGTSSCWRPGTAWAVEISAHYFVPKAGPHSYFQAVPMGTFPLAYSSGLPHDRGGVYYVNRIVDNRNYNHVTVDIVGTGKSCIESVRFFGYP